MSHGSEKFYIHNQIALDSGARADRVFVIVSEDITGVTGWACTVCPEGIRHPAYDAPISMDDIKLGEGRKLWYKRYRAQAVDPAVGLLMEVDFNYVNQMVVSKRLIAEHDAACVSQRPHRGLSSIADFKHHFPDSPGGLKVVAINPGAVDDFEIVYFEGNTDRGSLANFIASFAYVNTWTITIIPFEV